MDLVPGLSPIETVFLEGGGGGGGTLVLMRRALIAGLAVALVGFVPPKLKIAPRVVGTSVTVKSSGQMFDLINTTDCIPWPSEEVKALGGSNGWGGWRPQNGDQGFAIARSRHCFQDVNVVYVRIGAHYVAIGESGIQFTGGRLEDLPLLVLPKP